MSRQATEEEIRVLKAKQERIFNEALKRTKHRTKLLYDFAFCIDILLNDLNNALTFTNVNGDMLTNIGFSRERKRTFNEFLKETRRAANLYEMTLEPDLKKEAHGDWRREEGFRRDTNELIRLVMLYIDRIRTDEEAKAFLKRLEEMPEGDIFPKEVIDHFNFK